MTRRSPYTDALAGFFPDASPADLAVVEFIMRDSYSRTLDGLGVGEFEREAREAMRLLTSERAFWEDCARMEGILPPHDEPKGG